jgi:hypothetical protein
MTKLFLKPSALIIVAIFFVGGGLDFVYSVIGGQEHANYMADPKLTATSPAAIFLITLGFCGMLFIYWGGKDLTTFNSTEETLVKNIERQCQLRMGVGISLIGFCLAGLEVLLRVGKGV